MNETLNNIIARRAAAAAATNPSSAAKGAGYWIAYAGAFARATCPDTFAHNTSSPLFYAPARIVDGQLQMVCEDFLCAAQGSAIATATEYKHAAQRQGAADGKTAATAGGYVLVTFDGAKKSRAEKLQLLRDEIAAINAEITAAKEAEKAEEKAEEKPAKKTPKNRSKK